LTVEPNRDQHHLPGASLWPIGFALGVVLILVGIVLTWIAAVVGAAIAVFCATLWIRDASQGYSAAPPEVEPETRAPRGDGSAPRADELGPAMPVMEDEEIERYDRSVFLEASTLGLGALIGGIVAVPALGFMIAPAFVDQHPKKVDLGPISNFPENEFVIAHFLRDASQGPVSRRVAYIRNNGSTDKGPSFTILSNRCAHLGCPVQPNGPVLDSQTKSVKAIANAVTIIPMIPAGGFGCPCHGGQYDQEGNRTAGPPVRALDRFEYEIRNGNLVLLGAYSVSHVNGTGADAKIYKYTQTGPGQHVDGPEGWLYPVQPPH
jgi:menaquinol-cytochrome c reductase iron-sulfur subunit